jgi:hypothetical protein
MKKSVFARAPLVGCMLALSITTGFAQEQSGTAASAKVERDTAPAVESSGVSPQFVDPFRIYAGTCTVGPRNWDVIFRCWNLGFTSNAPRTVQCQTRNHPTQPILWPDQFACQVIRTSALANGSVWVRIRRLDAGTGGAGWGQNLQVSLLVVD